METNVTIMAVNIWELVIMLDPNKPCQLSWKRAAWVS